MRIPPTHRCTVRSHSRTVYVLYHFLFDKFVFCYFSSNRLKTLLNCIVSLLYLISIFIITLELKSSNCSLLKIAEMHTNTDIVAHLFELINLFCPLLSRKVLNWIGSSTNKDLSDRIHSSKITWQEQNIILNFLFGINSVTVSQNCQRVDSFVHFPNNFPFSVRLRLF